jgi:single-strand DNA-binding protein
MNNWAATGRLVKDPEINITDSGMTIVKITVAIKREFKNKKTNEYDSDFFTYKSLSNTDSLSNTVKYIGDFLHKGDLVELISKVENNNYEKDGEKVWNNDYIIKSISKLMSSRKNEESKDNTNNF